MGTLPSLDYILNALGVLAAGMQSRIRLLQMEFVSANFSLSEQLYIENIYREYIYIDRIFMKCFGCKVEKKI